MSDITAPTRAAALTRLVEFAPRMGRAYAEGRNVDPGPGERHDVARLSPHVRHRLVLESELVGTALAHHSPQAAEKFIQEVFWRSYWKGFLELRPQMWSEHRRRVAQEQAALATNGGLRTAHEKAVQAATGIECFDAWMRELQGEGWLHNHARMWFASIWIFTLRLPWPLGAALFERHLKDADAASNLLSWRWVAGIQTPGKHYLARAENIARYTGGRFDPRGELDETAGTLVEPGPPAAGLLAPLPPVSRDKVALLLHEDDLHIEALPPWRVECVAVLPPVRDMVAVPRAFTEGALDDAASRAAARFGVRVERVAAADLAAWADGRPLVTPQPPVGWVADALAGVAVQGWRRPWDDACFPLARKGFFAFREAIPGLLRSLAPAAP